MFHFGMAILEIHNKVLRIFDLFIGDASVRDNIKSFRCIFAIDSLECFKKGVSIYIGVYWFAYFFGFEMCSDITKATRDISAATTIEVWHLILLGYGMYYRCTL